MAANSVPGAVKRVAFVSTRIAGTDGVSLEIAKWADVIERMGIECYYITGESDRPDEKTFLIEEAHFNHPDISDISRRAFEGERRTPELTNDIVRLNLVIRDKLRRAVNELGVDALIEGSVQREGNIVRVTAQLIEAATDRHLWADRFERELTSILSLQGEVARAIAGEIEIQLTAQESERLATTREVNPETFELYLRGSFELNKGTPEGYKNGLALLHQAVDSGPTDPLAYAALGEGYVNLGHGTQARIEFFPRARAAAQRALELDPMNARAQSVLADVLVYYEWEWDEAEAAFQQAMQLDSNLPWTHFHYSWFLAKSGRLEEAVAEHEQRLVRGLADGLSRVPGVQLHGWAERAPHTGILSFTLDGADSGDVISYIYRVVQVR